MALDALKFVIQEEIAPRTRIRVLGVGGGGSNAVARMLQEGLAGVEFCVLNTDVQALASSPAPSKVMRSTRSPTISACPGRTSSTTCALRTR